MSTRSGPPGPVGLLRQLLRFDTSNPPGDVGECVSHLETALVDEGVETRRFGARPDRPILWARLPGEGVAPPLLFYGHADVVPAAPDRWTHDPFGGEVVDGAVWGRGALDMKGGLAMMAAALLRAARDPAPAGDLILLVLPDEEGTSEHGARYLVREHPELLENVRYAVGELGGFPLYLAGEKYYTVQVAAKRLCWLEAEVRGEKAGHGSLPVSGSAISRLAEFLSAISEARLPIEVTPPVERMIRSMIGAADESRRSLLAGLLDPDTAEESLERLPAHRSLLEALLRDTVNPTVVRAGENVNVVPERATVRLDGRLLPGGRAEDLIGDLRSRMPDGLGEHVHFRTLRNPSGQGEPDLGLLPLLEDLLRTADPGGTPIPFVLPAVTDAHYLAEHGVQTYGFLPMDLPPELDLLERIHAPDERVPVRSLRFGTRILHQLTRRYGREAP